MDFKFDHNKNNNNHKDNKEKKKKKKSFIIIIFLEFFIKPTQSDRTHSLHGCGQLELPKYTT